jgi:hypothetical protein
MGKKRNMYRLLKGRPEGNQDVGVLIRISWILERKDGGSVTGVVCLRIGTSGKIL